MVCEPQYLLELEYFPEPQIETHSGQPKVQTKCGEKKVEIEVGEAHIELDLEEEDVVVADVESEVVPNVEAKVEGDVGVDVEGQVEAEVEAVGDVHGEAEVEPNGEGDIHVGVNVEGQVEVEVEPQVEAMSDVQADGFQTHCQAEPQAEVEANGEGDMDVGVNVEAEGEVEGDGVDAQGQADIGAYEYDVRSWNVPEQDEFTDHGDKVEFDIFEDDDDRDGYGDFGIFSMPKSMEQYKWELRKIIDKHTCSRDFNIRLMTSKWLSGSLEKTIKENPNIDLYNLQNKVSKKWNIGVSRSTMCRAKAMAFKQIEGDIKEQYKRLYDYANELLRSNPSSIVKLHVEPSEDNPIFKRLYVCLKACKDSFVSCRPIIGLDGYFLKGKYGGELLIVVARDGNEQMCPLAYAVVEVENKDSWAWFLQLLINDLGGVEGLVPALQEFLPGVE
ncbi:uncharacterized protein LOC108339281 [Vigna angularis]|uniref:uncharacterized protein LOC108339281 n=1 Tax=Phaseolus angularis TaxID=3914 RepID=UPI000809B440|nr:uncharacterized protein LOC108339281 [Vigna angularis]